MQATGQRDTYALFQFFSEPCEDMVFLSERQGLRNQLPQDGCLHRPMGKQQIMPRLHHDPRPGGQTPWPMRDAFERRVH